MMLCWRLARKRHFLLLVMLACRALGAQSPSAGTDLQTVARKVALPPGLGLGTRGARCRRIRPFTWDLSRRPADRRADASRRRPD